VYSCWCHQLQNTVIMAARHKRFTHACVHACLNIFASAHIPNWVAYNTVARLVSVSLTLLLLLSFCWPCCFLWNSGICCRTGTFFT
jgi:hypothetical protein